MYKRIDFTKLNGLPIYQESLDFLQKSYRDSLKGIAEGLGNVIVSGATVSGPNYTDGWVILGGELMPFTGGAIQTNVVIQETIETETFEGGNIEQVYYTKRAVLASSGGVPFASLERMRSVEAVNDELLSLDTRADALESDVHYSYYNPNATGNSSLSCDLRKKGNVWFFHFNITGSYGGGTGANEYNILGGVSTSMFPTTNPYINFLAQYTDVQGIAYPKLKIVGTTLVFQSNDDFHNCSGQLSWIEHL